MMYLPLYIKSPANNVGLTVLGHGIIGLFVLILETHFKNPFKYNSFRLENIMASTMDAIDGVLILDAVKKAGKKLE
jgi:hypothetical protein